MSLVEWKQSLQKSLDAIRERPPHMRGNLIPNIEALLEWQILIIDKVIALEQGIDELKKK
jgi:hypothetical protein